MAAQTEIELKIGYEFWARRVNGHYGPGGDPLDFTVVGETNTLWKVRRAGHPDMPVTNMAKDGSDWKPLPAEDAQKIIWLRTNANKIENTVHTLTRRAYHGDVDLSVYDTLKAIDALLELRRLAEQARPLGTGEKDGEETNGLV